jgi:hypothetical protein
MRSDKLPGSRKKFQRAAGDDRDRDDITLPEFRLERIVYRGHGLEDDSDDACHDEEDENQVDLPA